MPDPVARTVARPITSVVIPVYNTRDYLPACLDSVLAQTQRDIEVILVDDGSTDGSLEVEEAYAAADPRVRVLRQPNLRQGAARNAGLAVARGEYVYFMDSDDVVLPTLLEECHAACEADGLDFCTFDSAGFAEHPDVEHPQVMEEAFARPACTPEGVTDGVSFWDAAFMRGGVPFACWLVYVRRSFLLDVGLPFPQDVFYEDYEWVPRMFLAARRMRYLPRRLHCYRRRPGSTTHAGFSSELACSCLHLYRRLLDLCMAQGVECRRQVLRDAGGLVSGKFAQFLGLSPDGILRTQVAAFRNEAVAALEGCRAGSEEAAWWLSGLLRLDAGIRCWPGYEPLFDAGRLFRWLTGGLTLPESAFRLGIYGTGNACSLLLQAFGGLLEPAAFFQTDLAPDTAGDAPSLPVCAVRQAGKASLDALLVASTRHVGAMEENARAALPQGLPIGVLSRAVLDLERWVAPSGWMPSASGGRLDFPSYRELARRAPSIVSNCFWGAAAFRALGLDPRSPFVGVRFDDGDFLRLLADLPGYMREENYRFVGWDVDALGRSHLVLRIGDVRARFYGVSGADAAWEAWRWGCARMNGEDVIVQMHVEDPAQVEAFGLSPVRARKICFTPFSSDAPFALQIPPRQTGAAYGAQVERTAVAWAYTRPRELVALLGGRGCARCGVCEGDKEEQA